MRLLPLPFDSVFSTLMRPDLVGAAHVRAAVGLLVEADDVDHADLGDRLGDQVDLRADEVFVGQRRVTGQERHLDRSGRRQLLVHQLLDGGAEALGQRVELEVHAGRQRLHVAARDGLAPLVPDHAAQHVQGRVGAHQGVAPLPVDLALDLGAGRKRSLDLVPDEVALLLHSGHRQTTQHARVVGLAAAGGIEGGAVERHPTLPHLGHRGRERSQVGVSQVEELGHNR